MTRPIRRLAVLSLLMAGVAPASAQVSDPSITSWVINTDGARGNSPEPAVDALISDILADVERVRYNDTDVYVEASGVPSFAVGPFGRPSAPRDQDFLVQIPRSPTENTSEKTPVSLGMVGVYVNGVALFNSLDAFSYNDLGIWNQIAVVAEADEFDACYGHPEERGIYHFHQDPTCLRDQLGDDGSAHSPVLGFAFDGFPVYGPYGYANTDGTGAIRRIRSGYQLRSITDRTTLADGTTLSPSEYGPAVSDEYPLGYYAEDYEYVEAAGDLDEHNGRFAVTPEYPQGTYAYYLTIDDDDADAPPYEGNVSAYPYAVGPTYYGVVIDANWAQTVTAPSGLTEYDPSASTASEDDLDASLRSVAAPNPFGRSTSIRFRLAAAADVRLDVFDVRGRHVARLVDGLLPTGDHAIVWDAANAASGVYAYRLSTGRTVASGTLTVHR